MQVPKTHNFDAYLANRPRRDTLRAARRKIAAGSATARELSATHTRSFPLQEAVSDAVWAVARDATRVLRGLGAPSLFDVVMTLHANGFRLFASGGERAAFGMRAMALSSGFDEKATAVFPSYKTFTVDAVRSLMSVGPRKVSPEIDAGVLAERMAKAIGVPKTGGVLEVPAFIQSAANEITQAFVTWKSMVADPSGPAKLLDEAIKSHGFTLPSLAKAMSGPVQVLPDGVGEPSVRFDAEAAHCLETDPTARFAFVIARYLRDVGGLENPAAGKAVQALVTTPNGNGMSWLFGVGRRVITDNDVGFLQTVFDAGGAPGAAAVTRLKTAMDALPSLSAMGDRVYNEARSTLQGTIDSLIANYVARLVALQASTAENFEASVPTAIANDAELFEGLPFDFARIEALYSEQATEAAKVREALSVLCGASSSQGYREALDAVLVYQRWIDTAVGQLKTLQSRLPKDADDKLAFDLPQWADGIDKPVEIRLPEAPPELRYPQMLQDLTELRGKRDRFYDGLVSAYGITEQQMLVAAMARVRADDTMAEARGISARKTTESYRERGMRYVLDRFLRAVRRCSPGLWTSTVEICHEHGLCQSAWSDRALKSYLQGGRSDIYLSAFSRRTVQVALTGLDKLAFCAFAHEVIDAAKAHGIRDQVTLESAFQQCYLLGLPELIDKKALEGLDDTNSWAPLDSDSQGRVAKANALKAINTTFGSNLSGLLYSLNRTSFIEKMSVACWMGTTLLFVPKATTWNPPVQYKFGRYAPFWELAVLDSAGHVVVIETAKVWAKHVASLVAESKAALMSLMRQLPHEWAVCCDFEGTDVLEGLMVSDGTIEKAWVKRKAIRLVCPPHFERELAESFLDRSISPHSLVFERELKWNGETVEEVGRKVVANIPIGTPTRPAAPWTPVALMAIDLGEAGIGITVKPLDGSAEISGFHPIKRLRKLAHSVEHYRRREQPRQSYRAKFSDSLQFAAEAAVGEICGVIDSLMIKFNAIPLFESQAMRAKGSTPMVPKVFEAVMAHYCYLSSPATAEATRKSHWYGALKFEISGLVELRPEFRKLSEEDRAASKTKTMHRPLLAFPGVMISGYGTSVTCSCCGLNALDTLSQAAAGGQVSVDSDGEGIARLVVGKQTYEIAIEAPSRNALVTREARKRNRRTPYERVVNAHWNIGKKTGVSEFNKVLRISMRRANPSMSSKRGHGSIFVCPFQQCQAVLDSDVNASTVLARRYFHRLQSEQIAQ